jgi:hypothetical protein
MKDRDPSGLQRLPAATAFLPIEAGFPLSELGS